MNVKKPMFEKNNKQNVFGNAPSLKIPSLNKNRTNIGEEIRKKLKISTPSTNSLSILMPRDMNIENTQRIRKQDSFKLTNRGDRQNMMQRSVELGRDTSRSVKSVRFEQKADQKKLTRKHSTSSILKNNKQTKKQRYSDKLSMNNSVCSNIMKEDQSTENSIFNKTCRQKYDRLYEGLKKSEKKYFDEMFPQIWSSISRSQDQQYKEMKWLRLSQLFSGKYLTVWDANESARVQSGQFSKSTIMATCLNSLKNNNFILQKMFECQSYNQYGLYYVKINQNNTWKYIIIDDYIPVYYVDKKPYPAFMNVIANNVNHVQLWPFLIQKAYAKYYGNYQCLDFGAEVDLLQELTGCYPEEFQTSNPQHFQQILHEVNNYDSILLAKDHQQNFHPILPRKPTLTTQSEDPQTATTSHTNQQFKQRFSRVYCIQLHKYFYSGFCTIKSTNNSLSSRQKQNKNNNKNHVSIRSIKIQEPTQCVFSLMQKDAKFYYLGDYRYVWVRLIVVMKESQKSYRWVGGVYANGKYANLPLWLEPAQYIVMVIPEWKDNKGYDLNLTFHGNIKSNIQRKPYLTNEHILIEAAMDLAQSKGRLKQLNQNICTYSYIEQNLGLIIQNINNERPNGFVRILRSIEGLQKCGQNLIRAYNKEFATNNTIQVKIQSLQHFTVVLAVQGGVNRGFLDQFDFGS